MSTTGQDATNLASPEEVPPEASQPASSELPFNNGGRIWAIFITFLVVMGGYYLRSYLASKSVPFPMELNVLGSSLLMMGIASTLLIATLASLLLFTVIIRMMPFGESYNSLIKSSHAQESILETDTNIQKAIKFFNNIRTSLTISYLSFTPIAILFSIILFETYYLDSEVPNSYLVVLFILLMLFLSIAFSTIKRNPNYGFFARLGFCFFIQTTVATMWTLPTSIIIQTGLISSNFELVALVAVLSVFYFIGLIPSQGSATQNTSSNESLIRSVILSNPHAFFAFFMIVILTILPPIASFIGKASLRFFEAGGGTIHEIVLSEPLYKDMKSLGLNLSSNPDSIKASLIYKINDISYYEIEGKVFPLNSKSLSISLTP